MLEVYRAELRAKNKLARKGKGSRRNNRYVALDRSEFSRHNYWHIQNGYGKDYRTNRPKQIDGDPKNFALSKESNRFETYKLKI